MIRLFSLIKSLYVRIGRKFIKYVSPPLVGVVFFMCLGIRSSAAVANISHENIIQMRSNYSHLSQYSETNNMLYLADNDNAGESVRIDLNNLEVRMPAQVKTNYRISFSDGTYPSDRTQITDIDYAFVKLHILVNGKEYILDMNRYEEADNNTGAMSGIPKFVYYRFSQDANRHITLYGDLVGNGRLSVVYYVEFCTVNFVNIYKSQIYYGDYSDHLLYYSAYGLPFTTSCSINYVIGESGISSVDYDNATIDSIERNTEQLQEYHEIDRSDAEQAGSDMTGFASQLDNLKNTWSILWYPIEFTNRFIQVFVGGTQAVAYQDDFAYITGYTYNDETGFLEPIMARSVQPASAGTGITFPAFSLMGYQIWDSYTYDLSQVKDQLPAVFDALYVIISILEMLWFVGYLRKKYEEVFG